MGQVEICGGCNGTGAVSCPICEGEGMLPKRSGFAALFDAPKPQHKCETCQGNGKLVCKICDGVGKIRINSPQKSPF